MFVERYDLRDGTRTQEVFELMYKNLAFTSQEFNIFSFSGCCVFVADTDIKATASNVGKDLSVIDILS